MPMNPVFKQLWIDALRSGEYRQAQRTLKDTDFGGFCCLGVACDLLEQASPNLVQWFGSQFRITHPTVDDIHPMDRYSKTYSSNYIPQVLADELGLDRETQDELAEMNDGENYDFNQIADWIEEYL